MTKKQYHNATGIFSTKLAIGSFLIGTVVLIMYLLFPSKKIIEIGFIYTLSAAVLNFAMLIYLIYFLITQKNHQEYYTIKILILLSNIPITLVYLKIVIENW